jgi:glutamate dehydrogenase
MTIYGAKVAAFARNDFNFEILLDREESDHAVYIDTSQPGVSNLSGPQYEQRYSLLCLILESIHVT